MSSQSNAPLLGGSSSSSSSGSAGSASSSASGLIAAWESARKKSRQLETQLYKKLQEFAQVQTALMNDAAQGRRNQRHGHVDLEMGRSSASASSASAAASSSSSAPANSAAMTPLLQYESLVGELEQLLSAFASTVDAMGKMLSDASAGGPGGARELASDANQYLLTKSRNILHDNQLEFRRTTQNIQAALARQELMSGASQRSAEGASMRGRTEQLLREGKSLQHSLDRADDVIAQAMSARDSLASQGSVFSGVRGKLGQLGATFPVVGQVMSRINVSKQRDMIVLACVIATCMFFTFVYVMSKP